MSARPAGAPATAYASAVALVVVLQFGPAIGVVGYRLDGHFGWTLIGAVRDVLVVLLLALAVNSLRHRPQRPFPASARWALALVVCFAVLAPLSPSAPNIVALNLRRLVLVPLMFLAVLLLPWSRAQVDALLRLAVATSVVVAAFGLFERFAPDTFWTEVLGVEAYTAATAVDRFGALPFDATGRFFSWDFGFPLRRLVSTYVEATTLAAGLAAAFCAALARAARGQRGARKLALLFALAGVLTLSKAFWLFLAALALQRVIGWPRARHAASLTLAALLLAWLTHGRVEGHGALAHLHGFVDGVEELRDGAWWGKGIGAAGNYTDHGDDTGGESGLGNAIAQVGWFGLLPLAWAAALGRELVRAAAARGDPGGPWLAMWLVFWLVAFLFSASSLGVGGNALGFLLLALYLQAALPARRPAAAAFTTVRA